MLIFLQLEAFVCFIGTPCIIVVVAYTEGAGHSEHSVDVVVVVDFNEATKRFLSIAFVIRPDYSADNDNTQQTTTTNSGSVTMTIENSTNTHKFILSEYVLLCDTLCVLWSESLNLTTILLRYRMLQKVSYCHIIKTSY